MPTLNFTGTERPPIVTTTSNPCTLGGLGLQSIVLGCPDTDPKTRNSINHFGLYAKATVTPPIGFISDGSIAYVEFRQLIKPLVKVFGRNISQCVVYAEPSPNGWREDLNGRDKEFYDDFLLAGFKIRSTFRNNTTGAEANAVLEIIDSPAEPLQNTSNNITLNKYNRDDQFELYVTYFAGLEDDENLGEDYRHALAVLPWKWNASAVKRSSGWQLTGIKYPQSIIQIESQPKEFNLTSTGERAFTGRFRDSKSAETCSVNQSVTITTKRNVAVWRKQNGIWYVINGDGTFTGSQWGTDYDIPVPGDYDGDGKADFAIYRPDNPATVENECQGGCSWYIIKSSDNSLQNASFGIAGDKPIPADYDGDGKQDVAVYRSSDSTWHILNSSDNSYRTLQYGIAGDEPQPSDYDGDGFDDIAFWRSSSATWFVRNSGNQTETTQIWGNPLDKPVIGDYDGDGKTDFAGWQPDGNWHILLSSNGQTKDVVFGTPGTDIPVAGNYDDDDKTDIAIWRTNGTQPAQWWILNSSNNQVEVRDWGVEGDIPVAAAYRR